MKTHLTCRVEVVDPFNRPVRTYDSVLCAGSKRADWPQTRDKGEVTCKRCLKKMDGIGQYGSRTSGTDGTK